MQALNLPETGARKDFLLGIPNSDDSASVANQRKSRGVPPTRPSVRERITSSRRRAVKKAKSVLRRYGHLLPREIDVRRRLTRTFSTPSSWRTA